MAHKTLTQGKVLKALHLGAQIMVENISHPVSEQKTTYRLTSTQKTVRPELVRQLLDDGLIQANNDCLPGIGESQTYSIARSSPSPPSGARSA